MRTVVLSDDSCALHLSRPKDGTRVCGTRIELVGFDPGARTATIRVSPPQELLTAEEGGYFGSGKGLRLVRVSERGVDLEAMWGDTRSELTWDFSFLRRSRGSSR
ncbi:MAG TPA: hypothetical protein PKK06_15170 [Phycisphaerae bacterium]|nr:hypothetical protein [Phycisphaerae bacterium]HNU46696.1 hypothetical protein [Phycisphaerae bacterium]